VQVEGGECPEPFLLDDGSGQGLVEPAGASLHPRRRDRWTGPHRNARARGPTAWFQRSDRYRFTEERIADGDLL